MNHLNNNILCALAIKATGPDAQKHELLEIAILPLTSECKIDKTILPFNILFRPEYIERAVFNVDNEFGLKCMREGMDKFDAADLFEKWYNKLNLRDNKKITVLCHKWSSKRDFIKEWLQPTAFNRCISEDYRDTQAVGLYFNDRADFRNEMPPFAKVKLSYMCAIQKVEYIERLPTVIDECQALINLYRSLLFNKIF